jgi:hypothetical protein
MPMPARGLPKGADESWRVAKSSSGPLLLVQAHLCFVSDAAAKQKILSAQCLRGYSAGREAARWLRSCAATRAATQAPDGD